MNMTAEELNALSVMVEEPREENDRFYLEHIEEDAENLYWDEQFANCDPANWDGEPSEIW